MSPTQKERLDSLEEEVFEQKAKQIKLKHNLDLELCKMTGALEKVESSQEDLKEQLIIHIDNENDVVQGIYDRLDSMDKELKESFKHRDTEITALKIGQAKMLAYATAAFIVINILIQVAMSWIK
jgi:hypothetical protein